MPDPDEVVSEAVRIVKAVSIAQVGDHHPMAEVEVMDQFDSLDDPDLLYAVVKTFAGTVAALASYTASEMRPSATGAEHEEIACEVIRRAIDGLGHIVQKRSQDDE